MTTGDKARRTEVMVLSSGKGGTGKTLIASCLGYALTRSGHKVLMVDADPGTDGLSLFLLGPKGYRQIDTFEPDNTFTGILRKFQESRDVSFRTRSIHRTSTDDHGISYEALISGKNVYGDMSSSSDGLVVPGLSRETFRKAVVGFFDQLRSAAEYDYVIVDTRGGFAFETTDICAVADSFILVTEPDYTSFYQDRNLVKRISAAAQQMGSKPVLRSIIVNKATEGMQSAEQLDLKKLEASFRLELTKEFPIQYDDIHAVPLDLEAVKAYKTQQIPYKVAPASSFSFSTLSAFSDILQVVTSQWSEKQVRDWNALVDEVSAAVALRNEKVQRAGAEEQERASKHLALETKAADQERKIADLTTHFKDQNRTYERERQRSELLLVQASRRATVLGFVGAVIATLLVTGGLLTYRLPRPTVDTAGLANDIAVLTKLGWTVGVDLDGRMRLQIGTIQPPWRSSAATLSKYKSIQISAPKAFDLSDIVPLGSSTGELELGLGGASDLGPLRNLSNLSSLNLSGGRVTDLSSVSALGNLRSLNLTATQVTDISALSELKKLTALSLDGTRVVDISALRYLTGLTTLSLANTRVVDISPLLQLKNLIRLDLAGTLIRNISPLSELPLLRELDLTSTDIDVMTISTLRMLSHPRITFDAPRR